MNFKDLEKLPSPPGVAVKLLELYSSADVSLEELNKVIGADPTLTARIIKFANSPTFARRHAATSLSQAIMKLGANGVKMIALSFSLTEIGSGDQSGKFRFDEFWSSSLATATCAKAIYNVIAMDGETGFLVGLLMNVGQLAMFCGDEEKYEGVLADRATNDLNLIDAEAEFYGTNRYTLAGDVLKKWGFPETLSAALGNLSGDVQDDSVETRALKLANQMSYLFLTGAPDAQIVQSFTEELARLTGVDVESTQGLYDSTLANYSAVAAILSYKCPSQSSLKEIEMAAKASIVEMTMDLHLANAQVRAENNQLRDLAFVDTLTGLGNRRQYQSMVEAELERCGRMGRSLGLVVIDIDHFKKVNDTYGHAAGDAILTGVSKRMENGLRSYDCLYRIGGEEFVLIQPEATIETCRAVAERLRKSIEAEPFEFEQQTILVTVSMGGAVFEPEKPLRLDELFNRADEALYRAKAGGRNQYVAANTASIQTPNSAPLIPTMSGFNASPSVIASAPSS